jgi:hypothetical protein
MSTGIRRQSREPRARRPSAVKCRVIVTDLFNRSPQTQVRPFATVLVQPGVPIPYRESGRTELGDESDCATIARNSSSERLYKPIRPSTTGTSHRGPENCAKNFGAESSKKTSRSGCERVNSLSRSGQVTISPLETRTASGALFLKTAATRLSVEPGSVVQSRMTTAREISPRGSVGFAHPTSEVIATAREKNRCILCLTWRDERENSFSWLSGIAAVSGRPRRRCHGRNLRS